jgi:uncharacterized protein YjbI with pentapeptide repeats
LNMNYNREKTATGFCSFRNGKNTLLRILMRLVLVPGVTVAGLVCGGAIGHFGTIYFFDAFCPSLPIIKSIWEVNCICGTLLGPIVLWGALIATLLWLNREKEDRSMTAEELLQDYRAGKRDFREATLVNAELRGEDLEFANFRKACLCHAVLSNTRLYKAELLGADLRKADLRGADLREANLRHADLRHADLRGADLRDAQLFGAQLSYAVMCDADFSRSDLSEAFLVSALMKNVVLANAQLFRADLSHADLTSSNLRSCSLLEADLSWACLLHADLSGACLEKADLFQASIGDAKLDDTNCENAIMPDGKRRRSSSP